MRRYVWQIGTLPPGEYKDIQVNASVTRAEVVESCVIAEYQPALCTKLEVTRPEIAVALEIIDEEERVREWVYACERPIARFAVRNTGDAPARNVRLVAELPEGLQTAEGRQQIEARLDQVPAGETVSRTVALRPSQPGDFVVRAMAASEAMEVYANPAAFRVFAPQLEVRVDGPRTEYVGRIVEHEITVTNTSDDPAIETQLLVSDTVLNVRPTFSTQQLAEEGNAIDIGVLDPGESRTFRYRFRAAGAGTASAKIVAKAFCVEEIERTLSTEIEGVPALQLEAVDSEDPLRVGGQTVYAIEIVNEGSAPVTNLTLVGELTPNLRFVEGSGATQVSGEGQNIQIAPLQEIPVGRSAVWNVTVEAVEAGNASLKLRVQSSDLDQEIMEIEPTTVR